MQTGLCVQDPIIFLQIGYRTIVVRRQKETIAVEIQSQIENNF